jgi:phosphatidylglycerophosphate synthase
MTPRVDRIPITLATGGALSLTGIAVAVTRFDASVSVGPFCTGAIAAWLFVCASLHHLGRTRGARLTNATGITLGRGFLVSLVAGFALGPVPTGRALWLPGLLYAVAAIGDGLDGALARRTENVTPLGAALDVTTDALGLLVAPLVAIRWARLPPWYLLLSAAYPVLRLGLRIRRLRRLPVFPERLRPDPRARLLAGVQMAVVAAALFPVLPRAVTWTAATLVMLPTLALFAGEWRLATRPSAGGDDARAERLHA